MMYVKYLRQLIRHKWFVFLAARRLGITWLGVIHDLSKFKPSEFVPYARFFYGGNDKCWWIKDDFDTAWNHHQKRNRHHWQYWMLTNDSDEPQTVCLFMPDKYRKEMIADWCGAGRAYGNPDTLGWYKEHREKIHLHADARWILEQELREL